MGAYLSNLGNCEEGKHVGAWFSLPIDPEDVAEKIGRQEEYAVHYYELPVEVGDNESIERLNRIYRLAEELNGTPLYDEQSELMASGYFDSLEDLIERQDDIRNWPECRDMSDVARRYVEENYFDKIPEIIKWCIDYERLGRAIASNGEFIVTKYGVLEIWCKEV